MMNSALKMMSSVCKMMNSVKHPDFVEGVGAVLRLSGEAKAPQWAASPSPDEVAAFFEPLEGGELVLE